MAAADGRRVDPRFWIGGLFAAIAVAVFWSAAALYFYPDPAGAAAPGFIGRLLNGLLRASGAVGGVFSALARGDWAQAASPIPWVLLAFPLGVAFRWYFWTEDEGRRAYAGNVFNDGGIRNFFFEMALLGAIGWTFWFLVGNAVQNLVKQNIATGFGFLSRNSGFQINQSPFIPYTEESSYGMVYLVGLQNTLVVAVIGILLATVIGFLVGIARLSPNWIVSRMAYAYVEVMRNVPLLLWLFIWYLGVWVPLMPEKSQSANLGPFGLLNVGGLYAPKPVFGPGAGWIGIALVTAIVASLLIRVWARRRQAETGRQFPVTTTAIALILGLPILAWIATGFPVSFEYPTASRFGPKGGMRLFPEFLSLLVALSTYTAAYIAEIVRSGILAISKGQTEASYALGLPRGRTLSLVVIPQAMRVIIPPLTSQYLNITKNSSLAVAIAYPDLVSTFTGTALNQTGQAVEIMLMTMLTYLTISLATSLFMNWYNARVALVER
jgi:general L-amino acid transport system permease protein